MNMKDSRRVECSGRAALVTAISFAVVLGAGFAPSAQNTADAGTSEADAAYITKFEAKFQKVDPPPAFDAYATAERYDKQALGTAFDKMLEHVSNETGGIAWGLAYHMMSLNEMYRVTKDPKYLAANLRCIEAVLAARDDVTGAKTWNGVVAPAWSSGKYAERGRAVFAVHTGIIVYPMLDFALLAKGASDAAEDLKARVPAIVEAATQSLAFHDRQWRDGPAESEGHYIGLDQEDVCENKPLPGNRLSAMGIALWTSWKVTGNETHRDRALALGHYIKNRLTLAPDGAYYWPYWLPEQPVTEQLPREAVKGEDVSHAALTMALPILLAEDGQVFTKEDMQRVANTVLKGFGRLGNGVLFGNVTGNPDAAGPEYASSPCHWLPLTHYDPAVRDCIVALYLNYKPSPGALDLALLLRYK